MDIHVQHLALLCQIEDHKRKINTNHFARAASFLKFTNLERFNVVGFSKCSSTVENQSKKQGKSQL